MSIGESPALRTQCFGGGGGGGGGGRCQTSRLFGATITTARYLTHGVGGGGRLRRILREEWRENTMMVFLGWGEGQTCTIFGARYSSPTVVGGKEDIEGGQDKSMWWWW